MNKIILCGCLIINDKQEILLLFRKDHKHYETPGGKLNKGEAKNLEKPTINEIKKAAQRELFEELGNKIKIERMFYFGKYKFTVPDGRIGYANKFITRISGTPKINEPQTFSGLKWLPIKTLEKYPISPDLRMFLHRLKKFISLLAK